jgi:hypothetical protein
VHHTILIYGVGWLISIVPEKDRVFTKWSHQATLLQNGLKEVEF